MALRFAVLGHPIGHSKSPLMHEAAYRALGLPHSYERVDTPESELGARVAELRRGEFAGLNVTVPHKTRVLHLVDEVHPSARATGAANTLVRTVEGRVAAHNTDMPAIAAELTSMATLRGYPSSLRGSVAMVVGTGGAARAAIVALASVLRVGKVIVRGRRFSDRPYALACMRELQEQLEASGAPGLEVELVAEALVMPAAEDPKLAAIVQATSCGMSGAGPGDSVANAIRWDSVPESAIALEVVYAPTRTPFLQCALSRGLSADNGLGMLVQQGALAFELWLRVKPPLDVMRKALLAASP